MQPNADASVVRSTGLGFGTLRGHTPVAAVVRVRVPARSRPELVDALNS